MSENPNKLIRFWQELKRRKTGKVIVAYAATAFILLQLADILTPALLLPDWTTRLVTLLLIIGFPVAVIFSWVFEITPEGIKKTESIKVSENKETIKKPAKKILSASNIIIAVLIIVVAILAYPKIFKRDTLEKLRSSDGRISVAILPFRNMSNDSALNYLEEWIPESVTSYLSDFSEYLQVRQTESINSLIQSKGFTNYASITPSVASMISQKLEANIFISGGIVKSGTGIILSTSITESKTEEILKSFQIEGTAEIINPIIDSLRKMVTNFLLISKLQKEVPPDVQYIGSTNSHEAYRFYTLGFHAYYDNNDYNIAMKWFLQALNIDSNFVGAMVLISHAYAQQKMYPEAKGWCLKAYERGNQVSTKLKLYIDYAYAAFFETHYERIKYCKQFLKIDDQSPHWHFLLGLNYRNIYQYEKAIPEYEKALEIYQKWGIRPQWAPDYTDLGFAYHKTGQYNKAYELYKKAEQDFPDNSTLIKFQSALSLTKKDSTSANQYIEKFKSILKENSFSDADIAKGLADIYFLAEIPDKAEKYYRQALSLEPENPIRMDNLAYFLIDKDRNVNEGMKLIDKVLKFSPDDYTYLHTKGWGLYKQGNYQEALEILQKSWDLRMKNAIYDHPAYLHLEAAKKAVAGLKNN
jgi:tetratricopeptide (TPR) repeat protein